MKYFYNKKELYGMWFEEDIEYSNIQDFTEKIPPGSSYVWDEAVGDWIKPLHDAEITIEPEAGVD